MTKARTNGKSEVILTSNSNVNSFFSMRGLVEKIRLGVSTVSLFGMFRVSRQMKKAVGKVLENMNGMFEPKAHTAVTRILIKSPQMNLQVMDEIARAISGKRRYEPYYLTTISAVKYLEANPYASGLEMEKFLKEVAAECKKKTTNTNEYIFVGTRSVSAFGGSTSAGIFVERGKAAELTLEEVVEDTTDEVLSRRTPRKIEEQAARKFFENWVPHGKG